MKASGIVTLLTDFGLSDPYVGMMKGVILSVNPQARLVDISHGIKAGSVLQGARIIRETYGFFPEGTVHVGVVDPGVGGDRRLIALLADGHAFVGPDNGLFWPVMDERGPARVIHLSERRFFLSSVTYTFHGRDVFAPVAGHLSLGVDPEEMGIPISDPTPLHSPEPYEKEGMLCGQILHVDHFGNLISNIESSHLNRFLGSARPLIRVGRLNIDRLSEIYSEVEVGQALALINSSNLLEIAVNLGRASEYVGLEKGDILGAPVRVGRQGMVAGDR